MGGYGDPGGGSAAAKGPRGSYVRLLSLLAYELLGGPRARLDATGQYTPVATLTREGNAVLRRGLVDEFQSAGELSRQLSTTVGTATPSLPPPSVAPETMERVAPESLQRTPPSKTPPDVPIQRKSKMPAWLMALALGVMVLAGIGIYLFLFASQDSGNHRPFGPDRTIRRLPPAGRQAASGSPEHIHARPVWDSPTFGYSGSL